MTLTKIEARWHALTPAPDKAIFQLLDAEHPFKFYIGKEQNGDILFLLVDSQRPLPMKSMRSVKISSHQRSDGQWSLLLTLSRRELAGLFALLCEDLIAASRALPRTISAMTFMSTRLGNWRRLIEQGQQSLLSPSEVRGLFGEMTVLEKLFLRDFPVKTAIEAWVGPMGADQDFQTDRLAYEVKTIQVDAPAVAISSERQLFSTRDEFKLVLLTLSESDEGGGESLNTLVARIRNQLLDTPDALETFDERVAVTGYLVRAEYDFPLFRIAAVQSFVISDDFPKILPSMLDVGVHEVRYQIALSALTHCKVESSFSV